MRFPVILASLLLAGAPALAATPAAVQAEQSPAMPGAEGGFGRHGNDVGGPVGRGGKLAGFFTPEQRAMFMAEARDQLKDMTKEQRKAWRKDQVRHVMAMSASERTKLKTDLQARWDALPQDRKDRIQQKLARLGGQNPAQ